MIARVGTRDGARAWLLIEGDDVPPAWRDRALAVTLVPLLPEEAREVLSDRAAEPAVEPLEETLLRLLGRGLRTGEIAREAGMPQRSVQRHLARLRRRFGVASNGQLAAVAAHVAPSRTDTTDRALRSADRDAAAPAADAGKTGTPTKPSAGNQRGTA